MGLNGFEGGGKFVANHTCTPHTTPHTTPHHTTPPHTMSAGAMTLPEMEWPDSVAGREAIAQSK